MADRTEQHTTPEQRQALRARYTPEPVPTCKHCGGEMVPSDFSAAPGRPFYECPVGLAEALVNPTGSAFHLIDSRRIVWQGDPAVLAAVADADALVGALAERERYWQALRAIQGWDCLNPPQADLCADFPWLRRLVDAALAPQSGAGQEGAPDAPRMPQDAPHGANSPKARSAKIAGATGDSGAKTGGIEG